jgi:hypothetical protein
MATPADYPSQKQQSKLTKSAIHFIHHPKPELSFAMANHCAQLLPIITVNKQAA